MSKANRRARGSPLHMPSLSGGIVADCEACHGVVLTAREALDLSGCPACGKRKWRIVRAQRFDYAAAIDFFSKNGEPLPAWVARPVRVFGDEAWRGL